MGLRRSAALAVLAVAAVSCGESGESGETAPTEATEAASPQHVTLTLVTHDAFAVSEGVIERFEADTGIAVEVLTTADVGTMVGEAILTAGDPVGDVLYGIDNTFLSRALDADLFVPHRSERLDAVVPALLEGLPTGDGGAPVVTPIDYGDVCVNVWTDALAEPPGDLAALAEPAYAASFVTESPETSSPGLAFLLATIAAYGDPGWETYWEALRDNGVAVTPDWTTAYYEEFVAGGGERALVTSYASSPVAEVVFADPPVDAPPTAVVPGTCFRQVEYAGILRGTDQVEAAGLLVDFLLSPTFQEDIPLQMFVFPAATDAALPEVFVQHAAVVEDPLTLSPEEIEAGRDDWTARWNEIVLG